MNNAKDKIIQRFNEELEKYETINKIHFNDNAKIKMANDYALTLLLEKDIDAFSWLEENIEELKLMYEDDFNEKE